MVNLKRAGDVERWNWPSQSSFWAKIVNYQPPNRHEARRRSSWEARGADFSDRGRTNHCPPSCHVADHYTDHHKDERSSQRGSARALLYFTVPERDDSRVAKEKKAEAREEPGRAEEGPRLTWPPRRAPRRLFSVELASPPSAPPCRRPPSSSSPSATSPLLSASMTHRGYLCSGRGRRPTTPRPPPRPATSSSKTWKLRYVTDAWSIEQKLISSWVLCNCVCVFLPVAVGRRWEQVHRPHVRRRRHRRPLAVVRHRRRRQFRASGSFTLYCSC